MDKENDMKIKADKLNDAAVTGCVVFFLCD